MAFVVIYAATREEGIELKLRLEESFLRLTTAATVNVTVPTAEVLAARGVSSLPAILWVESWADNFLILSQGRDPHARELSTWIERYALAQPPKDNEIRAHVFGFITDRRSGKPLVGAGVMVQGMPIVGGPYIVGTDLDGRYELPLVHPGGMILLYSFSAEKSTSAAREIVVREGDRLRVDVQLNANAASDVPYDVIRGELSGVCECGFEKSAFLPEKGVLVDSRGEPREVKSVWVEFSKLSGIGHLVSDTPIWIRCTGTWAGPGRYGYRGGSSYYLEVDQILEARESSPPGSWRAR